MNKPLTLLIHGLHMHGIYMAPLARNLTKEGFSCQTFSYNSLTKSIDVHSKDLHAWLIHHHDGLPINLIGHSLGGLIIRHFVATYGHHWHVHRCVSLGTPHRGSICASYAHRLCPPLVGQSYSHALDGTCVKLPHNITFGAIAGTRPLGLVCLYSAITANNIAYQAKHAKMMVQYIYQRPICLRLVIIWYCL